MLDYFVKDLRITSASWALRKSRSTKRLQNAKMPEKLAPKTLNLGLCF